MRDIKLDPLTWDIDISNLNFQLTDSTSGESLAQKLRIALLLWKGEWFVNANDGVPYLQQIFSGKGDKALTDAVLRQYILGIEGVQSLSYFESKLNKPQRKYTLNFEVVGTDGTTARVGEFTL